MVTRVRGSVASDATEVDMQNGNTVEDEVNGLAAEIDQIVIYSPTFSADLNLITESNIFYSTSETLNSPLGLSGTVDSIVVNASAATQRFVSTESTAMFFRFKSAGGWGIWQKITAQEIFTTGWPSITGDNAFDEIQTDTAVGWTVINGMSVSTSAGSLIFDTTGTTGRATKPISFVSGGDWITYATVSLSVDDGSDYLNVELVNGSTFVTSITLGYNFSLGQREAGRISMAAASGPATTFDGPVVDLTVPVRVALYYNNEFESLMLYVLQGGEWAGYGPISLPAASAFGDTARVYFGSASTLVGTLSVSELFYAKPNIVSIGDSITEGATLFAPDWAEGLRNYASCWQAYAGIYLTNRNSIVVNKGIGSQTSAQIDARMSGILTDAQPKVVILQASNNDSGGPVPLGTRTANIQGSVDKSIGAGAKVILVNSVYPNADAGAQFPASGDYLRNWWENERINITDVSLKIDWMQSGILDGNYMNTVFTQADGVHPTPAGYELLGDYIQSLEA